MTSQTAYTLPRVAARLDRMPPYGFELLNRKIGQLTAAGKDVIRIDIGSPDMPPAPFVIDALKRSADNPKHHTYGSYRGFSGFRKAVADYYKRRFNVELDSDREVLPLIGSKEGLVNLALAFIDHGDAAICPDLNYPAYTMGTIMAGGETITMRLDPERDYRPDLDALRREPALSRAKLLWVNYPNNPTGAVCDLSLYQELVDFCQEHNLLLCSDNPYSEVVFDGYTAPSALQASGAKMCTVEFMSFSKTYNMAGWRLGAAVGNASALDALLTIKSNMDSAHWRAVYDGGIAALNETTQAWLDARNAVYQARRDKLYAACAHIGLTPYRSHGSLYVWAKVDSGDDAAYVNSALETAHVSITPGTMYGPAGAGWVRLSIGIEDSRLDEAIQRLTAWYAKR